MIENLNPVVIKYLSVQHANQISETNLNPSGLVFGFPNLEIQNIRGSQTCSDSEAYDQYNV